MEYLQTLQGFFFDIPVWATVISIAAVTVIFGYTGAPLALWALAGVALLAGFSAPLWAYLVFGVLALLFNVPVIRRIVITGPLMNVLDQMGILPNISETQRVAIESGTVWVEGEFFSGDPDFDRIMSEAYPELSERERAFLDGPVEELCAMVDDWDVHVKKDLPEEAWEFMKEKKFYGMIVPEEYGGLDFSKAAHSAVIQKLASRNYPLAVTVMVPNSLGPAELLLNYGTDEQKDHYLPRLATGEEMPAFGLTEPTAGSDATAVASEGVLYEGEDGELMMRLNWQKRYITLSAVSTLLGLAFRLKDPEGLVGDQEDLGITCALIPTDMPGVETGERHDPLGVPFVNGPTEGHDVEVPASQIIGGIEQAGNGWRMLSESLAEGRGVSLPAAGSGTAKKTSRVVGAYASMRQQFGLPIARFEGVEEKLANIAGMTYLVDAMRTYTAGALDSGAKPGVVSAIAKYNGTELQRDLVDDGMDVLGGAGIIMGPRNLMATTYWAIPISITVEGANILTRTLMIFGQGVIRCHPYAYDEVMALENKDVKKFDELFFKHIGFVFKNCWRATLLNLTRGAIASSPVSGPTAKYWKRLSWASANFAFMTDLAMGSLGGALQRKEKITGRFADVLSWLYIGSSVLRRWEADGRPEEDLPLVEWSMEYAFGRIQEAFEGLYQNIPVPGLGWFMRGPISAWARINPFGTGPTDSLGHDVARVIQQPGEQRDRLTADIYVPESKDQALGHLEHALELAVESQKIYAKIRDTQGDQLEADAKPKQLVQQALDQKIISQDEFDLLREEKEARKKAIAVDSFSVDELPVATPTPGEAMDDQDAA